MNNLILLADSYKHSHFQQFPKNTTNTYYYLESRGGKYPTTTFFGLQYLLKKYLLKKITYQDIEQAEQLLRLHQVPFNKQGWTNIVEKYSGRLPVEIRAVPEGSTIPTHNILLSIENTDPEYFWLPGFLETLIVQNCWYPTTVCTLSRHLKGIIREFLEITGDPVGLPFKLHDFGFRGVSSVESSAIGGAAHLVNFQGTDTLSALEMVMQYYNEEDPQSFSIPASEHSTITSWGKEGELAAFSNMLDVYPTGLVACVSDSYDIFSACENLWGTVLKERILKRDGTVVIRPDCYDDQTEIFTNKGWVLFKDLDRSFKVAQFYKGNIDFTASFGIVDEAYSGPMVSFKDEKGRLDLMVTPNHRMVLFDQQTGVYKVEEAEQVKYYYGKDIPRAGFKIGNDRGLSALERLLIAFQADGSYPSGWNPNKLHNKVNIRFNFAKERKAKRLSWICEMGGFPYSVRREPARPQNYNIYIELPFVPSKTFDWVKLEEINGSWCREFIDELSYWDATRRTDTRFKYDTTIKENADMVQAIACMGNIGATHSVFQDDRKEHFSDIHSVSLLTHKNFIGGHSVNKTISDYSGRIYCVKVPSGMVIVRRNNKVCVSGNSGKPVSTVLSVLDILTSKFGHITNTKGYKVLPPQIRVIQGDGVNAESIQDILTVMTNRGYSADNIAFGMGGALLQAHTRDTQNFALKCSQAKVNGEWREVYKDPVGDVMKKSKRGRLALIETTEGLRTIQSSWPNIEEPKDILRTVFRNGELLVDETFTEIRNRASN